MHRNKMMSTLSGNASTKAATIAASGTATTMATTQVTSSSELANSRGADNHTAMSSIKGTYFTTMMDSEESKSIIREESSYNDQTLTLIVQKDQDDVWLQNQKKETIFYQKPKK